jgi:uncharacterized protein (TIGR00730 family)
MKPAVCVYCASSFGHDPYWRDLAASVGQGIGERGWTLVYGGANVGMMGTLADSCLAAGGSVVGVIPKTLVDREVAHHGLTRLEIVETMHERKARMTAEAGAFVALPGALGTLDELFEALTWAQLKIHEKPVFLLNVRDYYTDLLRFLDGGVREGFLRQENRGLLRELTSLEELFRALEGHFGLRKH